MNTDQEAVAFSGGNHEGGDHVDDNAKGGMKRTLSRADLASEENTSALTRQRLRDIEEERNEDDLVREMGKIIEVPRKATGLLDIPSEIREQIYRYVWRAGPNSTSSIQDAFRMNNVWEVCSVIEGERYYGLEGYNLLFVNKLVSKEARYIGLSECTVVASIYDQPFSHYLDAWKDEGMLHKWEDEEGMLHEENRLQELAVMLFCINDANEMSIMKIDNLLESLDKLPRLKHLHVTVLVNYYFENREEAEDEEFYQPKSMLQWLKPFLALETPHVSFRFITDYNTRRLKGEPTLVDDLKAHMKEIEEAWREFLIENDHRIEDVTASFEAAVLQPSEDGQEDEEDEKDDEDESEEDEDDENGGDSEFD